MLVIWITIQIREFFKGILPLWNGAILRILLITQKDVDKLLLTVLKEGISRWQHTVVLVSLGITVLEFFNEIYAIVG